MLPNFISNISTRWWLKTNTLYITSDNIYIESKLFEYYYKSHRWVRVVIILTNDRELQRYYCCIREHVNCYYRIFRFFISWILRTCGDWWRLLFFSVKWFRLLFNVAHWAFFKYFRDARKNVYLWRRMICEQSRLSNRGFPCNIIKIKPDVTVQAEGKSFRIKGFLVHQILWSRLCLCSAETDR